MPSDFWYRKIGMLKVARLLALFDTTWHQSGGLG